jgi:hypothetical protein
MKCREAERITEEFLAAGNELPPAQLMEHLQTCRSCGERFTPLLAIASELLRMPQENLPEGFDARFQQKMARRLETGDKKYWVSAMLWLLAIGEIRWILILALSFSLGSITAIYSGSLDASRGIFTFPAPNIMIVIACPMFASAICYCMFSSDFITNILKRRAQ